VTLIAWPAGLTVVSERSFTPRGKAGRMARRYVSVKEVAAKAGMSFQTASKVLNGGNMRVSAETAARIIAAAPRSPRPGGGFR
jgi:transcriptional regulator with XRE-family HTH domain